MQRLVLEPAPALVEGAHHRSEIMCCAGLQQSECLPVGLQWLPFPLVGALATNEGGVLTE